MLKQDEISDLSTQIRNTQIIAAALILGVLGFLGVMFIVVPFADLNWNFSILVIFGLLFALPAIAVSLVVPMLVGQSAAKRTAERLKQKKKYVDDQATIQECATHFQTGTILRGATLEAACFLNLIVFFLEHSLVSLSVAAAMMMLMAANFPTTGRALEWIENQLERVRDYSRSSS